MNAMTRRLDSGIAAAAERIAAAALAAWLTVWLAGIGREAAA